MPHSAVVPSPSPLGDHGTATTQEKSPSADGKKMTKEGFRKWLKSIDVDGDGKITWPELRDALRGLGMYRARWKAWRAMVHADLNGNKAIDIEGDVEVEELIKYAQKRWGIVAN